MVFGEQLSIVQEKDRSSFWILCFVESLCDTIVVFFQMCPSTVTLLACVAVAFSATLQSKWPHEFIGPFSKVFTLKYGNVITNVGNAYDPKTGK